MKRTAVLLLVLVAVGAGCGGGGDESTVAQEGTSSTTGEASEGADDFNDADVTFAQSMIPHHRQAVEMAALAADRAGSAEVKDLASRIQAAQGPEIETMTAWLEQWGETMDQSMQGMDMSGGMSKEEMAQLEGASGAEFDRMFLEMMREHHRSAVEMAQTEVKEGQNADAVELARKIVEDQTAEIQEIEGLLAEL